MINMRRTWTNDSFCYRLKLRQGKPFLEAKIMKTTKFLSKTGKAIIFSLIALMAFSQTAFAKNKEVVEDEESWEEESTEVKEKKGRGAFYFTADTTLGQLPTVDFSSITLNNINGDLTWKLGNNVFMGLEGGYNMPAQYWDAGMSLGLNLNLGQIRPYVMATGLYESDQRIVAKVGGGLDLKFGVFMLTLGYNYKMSWDISGVIAAYDEQGINSITLLQNEEMLGEHLVYAGIGLSW